MFWKKQGINPKNLNELMGKIPPNPGHQCPWNLSSKSMEPIGTVKMIVWLFGRGGQYASTLISNHHSTL